MGRSPPVNTTGRAFTQRGIIAINFIGNVLSSLSAVGTGCAKEGASFLTMKQISSTALLLAVSACAIVASVLVFNIRFYIPHAFELGVGIPACVGLFALFVQDLAQDHRI